MKTILFVGDGMADEPLKELGNATPLQYAKTPNLDRLAKKSFVGSVQTVFKGLPCGSEIANLTLLGYNPYNLPPFGRGGLEAASMNIDIPATGAAYRCNLVTVTDSKLQDYSGGPVHTETSHRLIKALNEEFGNEIIRFYPGKDYRHILLINPGNASTKTFPPHDYIGKPIDEILPVGRDQDILRNLYNKSHEFLEDYIQKYNLSRCKANAIWPWGASNNVRLKSISERFEVEGSVIAGVDLIRGIGRLAGLHIVDVPGATGRNDTDYTAKINYGLRALKETDFIFVHVESPDEAGHHGNIEEKVSTIEDIDSLMIRPIVDNLSGGEFRLLFMPDHATPINIRTHVYNPVPYLIYPCPLNLTPSGNFNEETARKSGVYIKEGWTLIDELFMKTSH